MFIFIWASLKKNPWRWVWSFIVVNKKWDILHEEFWEEDYSTVNELPFIAIKEAILYSQNNNLKDTVIISNNGYVITSCYRNQWGVDKDILERPNGKIIKGISEISDWIKFKFIGNDLKNKFLMYAKEVCKFNLIWFKKHYSYYN